MKYRLTIDFETTDAVPPTLWDLMHNAPDFFALAMMEIQPKDVSRIILRRLDGSSISAAMLDAGEDIDIREFFPS